MSFAEHRSKFSILVYLGNTEDSTAAKLHLSTEGYEAFMFADQDTLLSRVKQAVPHVIFFSSDALMTPLSEFVSQVLEINSEIQFVFVGPIDQAEAVAEYREYNFAQFVANGPNLLVRGLWAIDSVCERLYLTYMNESLISERDEATRKHKEVQGQISVLQSKASSGGPSVVQIVNNYKGVQSKEDAIQMFLSLIPAQALFFRFLPTVQTFVATTAKGIDIESIKGVGARLQEDEFKNLNTDLLVGKLPATLDEFVRGPLKVSSFFIQRVQPFKTLEGIFVFWGASDFSVIENDFTIFHLVYQNLHFMKRSELLDVHDPVSELYNANYFHKKIEEEVSRARRLKQPVSLVLMSIDHFAELEQSLGKNNRDLILKSVATIIQKTSRVNDLAFRSGENELALLLPHSPKKGGTLRAERLRRIIEAHSFTVNGLKVSVSSGVSEYPSLCSSSEELDASARQALDFIVSRGGNKVCLFQPPSGFVPDYEVAPV